MRKSKPIDGGTIGLLAGCIIIGLSVIVIAVITGGAEWKGWPHEWDTMIVGVTAVVAAFFAIRETKRQIAQVDEHRRDDLERENYAARAVLPVALSRLSNYAKACVVQLLAAIDLPPADLPTHEFSFPEIPNDIIPVIRDCVRFADGGKRRELADLLRKLQIQHARLAEFSDHDPGHLRLRINVIEYCVDSIGLFGRASALFDYGRREADSAVQPLQGVAMVCGAIHGMQDDLDKRIAAAAPRYLRELESYRL
jgi:hypothetical protein